MERMAGRYRQMQRATVARSALDVIALIFLGAGFAFWGVAFWQLLAPPQLASLGTVSVLVLTVVYTLAAPLLLSMLVPTTPAGQLLQKTQWATVGFPVIVCAALFLSYQGYALIANWLSAQGGVDPASGLLLLVATGQVTPMAISLSIAFILIPALAWVQLTPERWLGQIQQAHQVKKLEMQQRGELAIIKASILSAERKAIKGWANLLPLEREEVFSTMRGLLMSTSDVQRDIVRTLGLGAELERDIMSDEAIAQQLEYVAQQIDVLPDIAPPRSLPAADDAAGIAAEFANQAAREYHQDAIPVPPQPRPATAGIAAPQRPAAPRSAPQRYAAEYATAAQAFGSGVFTVAALAETLDMNPRTARERLNAWIAAGRARTSDTKAHFYLTNRGGT
jgi:hypothetical protein